MILAADKDYFLKQIVFVIEKCCVFFEVRMDLLSIFYMKFGFSEWWEK
jgi:hypothetical protein